jgi:glycosyltransferase involved in cell wall biosynthesis
MLLDAPFPPDVRIKKELEPITKEKNIELHLICLKGNGQKAYEKYEENIFIHRVNVPFLKYNPGIIKAFNAIFKFDWLMYFKAKEIIKTHKLNIVHFHDLPLANVALCLKEKFRIKVIADLHENYAEGLNIWQKWSKNLIRIIKDKILFNYNSWKKYEGKAVGKSDHIIAVVEEMKDRLIEQHKLEESKLTVITNTESKGFIENDNKSNIVDENTFSIGYVGGIGPHRGLQTMIKAIPEISKQIPEVMLYIVGKGNSETIKHLKQIEQDLGISKYIKWCGQVNFDKVYPLMKAFNINAIPHISNPQTDNTIPHKLFQIMMSGSCLLVSSSAPLKRIANKYDAGFIFEAGDHLSFAKKVFEIHKNKKEVEAKINNAKKATLNGDLNWEKTSEKLIELYNKIGQ